ISPRCPMMRLPLLLAAVLLLSAATARAQNEPKFLKKTPDDWAGQLRSADPGARRSAAFALGKMGTRAAKALPELKARLREEKDPKVKEALACALGEVASNSLQASADVELERLPVNAGQDVSTLVRRSAVY